MEREIIFNPTLGIDEEGVHPEASRIGSVNIFYSKDALGIETLGMRCGVHLNNDGWLEFYMFSIPVKEAIVLKNYLTLLSSPSCESSGVDSHEVKFGDIVIKSKAKYKEVQTEEGYLDSKIEGYVNSIILTFSHLVDDNKGMFGGCNELGKKKFTLNLDHDDTIEFIRTFTYLRIN